MALVIPTGYGLAIYRFSLVGDAEEMLTTLGVGMAGAYGSGQGAADQLYTDFVAGFPAANLQGGYTFLGVRFLAGAGTGPSAVFESTGAPVVGTAVDGALPPNCAFLVSKKTGLGGRRNRGRMYFPPAILSEISVPSTGVMAEAQRSVIQTRINTALMTGDKVILHDSASPGGTTPTVITSLQLQARLATQRRRLRP